ncbi:DUF2970 domain-containing protein [Pontibacterium sp.]|jgi:hypothetical protein|uniref:DUF2970 domain-containing protein n=1 Tax=Pontibacterium sp. TaxID=2036026 RepID=UPI003566C0A5
MSHKPNLIQMFLSVLAACFGVQSSHNQERDFAAGHTWAWMLLGLAAMGLFVVFVIFLVSWALSIGGA